MIAYQVFLNNFQRNQNRTLWADINNKRFIVKRAGKGLRYFLGKINGKLMVRGNSELDTIAQLSKYVN